MKIELEWVCAHSDKSLNLILNTICSFGCTNPYDNSSSKIFFRDRLSNGCHRALHESLTNSDRDARALVETFWFVDRLQHGTPEVVAGHILDFIGADTETNKCVTCFLIIWQE